MSKIAEVDFEIVSENWTRYKLLPDNTTLRARAGITKLLQTQSARGEVGYAVVGQPILSVLVPHSVLKEKGTVPQQLGEPTSDQINSGTVMELKPLDEKEYWQEYRTSSGWIVMVKLEISRVVKLQTYSEIDQTGQMEPAYWAEWKIGTRGQAATAIKGVDSSYTIKPGKERLESANFWAQFRVKKDDRRGDEYVDVLIGNKYETKPHSHIGINLDQSTRFVEPRGMLNTMRREIDSKLRGRLADETLTYSVPKEGKPKGKLVFQLIIDEPTRTITPKFGESRIEEERE
jgi:hypothetical protein